MDQTAWQSAVAEPLAHDPRLQFALLLGVAAIGGPRLHFLPARSGLHSAPRCPERLAAVPRSPRWGRDRSNGARDLAPLRWPRMMRPHTPMRLPRRDRT